MEQALAALQSLQGAPAYGLVFALLVGSGFFLPVNEDLLLVAAAAATLRGVMEPMLLVTVAWCGILCADSLIFLWGRRFGTQLLRHRLVAGALPPRRLAAMERALGRWGSAALFAVRFLPGLRTPLLFTAGSLRVPYRQLLMYDGTAAAIEIPLLVYGVRWAGGRWEDLLAFGRANAWAVLAILLAAAAVAWAVRRAWR
ncbi:DedA family protein [Ramlibacter humi]|nr:VTT domain-containing protein [Ramlibacter humi]